MRFTGLGPPPELLDELGAAAARAAELAAGGHELHFERDAVTGRVVVQMRDLRTCEVVATMSPAMALDYLREPRSRRRR